MEESISCDNTRFGITLVEPNRALKKCRIRKLRIEYWINDFAVAVVIPKSCGNCDRMNECTDDFILQIIEKGGKKEASDDQFIF